MSPIVCRILALVKEGKTEQAEMGSEKRMSLRGTQSPVSHWVTLSESLTFVLHLGNGMSIWSLPYETVRGGGAGSGQVLEQSQQRDEHLWLPPPVPEQNFPGFKAVSNTLQGRVSMMTRFIKRK